MQSARKTTLHAVTACGILCAAAYVVAAVARIPVFPSAPYLKIDFKDAIIALGGFIYGPLAAVGMAVAAAFVEFVTVSESGFIGFIMNTLSTGAFAVTAALIYKYHRNIRGVFSGLLSGCAAMTATMLLWNYLITPIYTGMPREAVAGILLPVILPFNLIKTFLNAALTLMLYRPLVAALRRAKLLPEAEDTPKSSKTTLITIAIGAAVAAACVAAILLIKRG
ncbi:MAG: ECF transporter S component [Clostridia bacterium]|nr:ECF transporter S component [Clostridia bacterium]